GVRVVPTPDSNSRHCSKAPARASNFFAPALNRSPDEKFRPQDGFFGRRSRLAITRPTITPVTIPPIPATSEIFFTAIAVIGLLNAFTEAWNAETFQTSPRL